MSWGVGRVRGVEVRLGLGPRARVREIVGFEEGGDKRVVEHLWRHKGRHKTLPIFSSQKLGSVRLTKSEVLAKTPQQERPLPILSAGARQKMGETRTIFNFAVIVIAVVHHLRGRQERRLLAQHIQLGGLLRVLDSGLQRDKREIYRDNDK